MRPGEYAAASELLTLRAEFDELPASPERGVLEDEAWLDALAEHGPIEDRRIELILAMVDAQKRAQNASNALASIGVEPFDELDDEI